MRSSSRVVAVLLFLAAAVLCPAEAALADSNFTVIAGADIARYSIAPDPAVGAKEAVDPGWGVTEARVSSKGKASSFASTIYPSQAFTTAVPAYPLQVRSQHPSRPTGHAAFGTVTLDARTGSSFARAYARDGANRTEVEAAVNPVDDTVRGSAKTALGVFDVTAVGGYVNLLSLDAVRATASVVLGPGGELKRSSDLIVGGLSVSGQRVALPLDLKTLSGLPAIDQLAEQGVELAYLAPVETEHGIVSAGLKVSWLAEVPGYGTARITAVLGRAYASVTNEVLPAG